MPVERDKGKERETSQQNFRFDNTSFKQLKKKVTLFFILTEQENRKPCRISNIHIIMDYVL